MKQIKSEKVFNGSDFSQVDTYYRWKRKVGDQEMEFFLFAEPGTDLGRKLFIAEMTTGFGLGVGPLHPLTGVQLTCMSFKKHHGTYVPGAKLRHLARACCHRALNNIGHEKFVNHIGVATLHIMAGRHQAQRLLPSDMTPREKLVEQLSTLRSLQQGKHALRTQQNLEMDIEKVEQQLSAMDKELLSAMDKEPDRG